jgi:hypothetical protein
MHTYFGHVLHCVDVTLTVDVPDWQIILEDDNDFFKYDTVLPKEHPNKGKLLGLIT